MTPSIGIIVQARFDSSRFPGKACREIWDSEIALGFLLKRIALLDNNTNQKLILATADTPDCDVLQDISESLGIDCFRGDKYNVFSRYWQCVSKYKLDVVVRITADCVLHCPILIQSFIQRWKKLQHYCRQDFIVTNKYPFSYCDGFDVEVFSSGLLQKAEEEVNRREELQEHVTTHFYSSKEIKKINILSPNPLHFPTVRLVMDYPSDLIAIKMLISDFLNEYPEACPIKHMSYSAIASLPLFRSWVKNPSIAPNYQHIEQNSTLFI